MGNGKILFLRAFFIGLLLALIGSQFSCSKKEAAPIITDQVLPYYFVASLFPESHVGDRSYSVINSTWLQAHWPEFRDDLFAKDVVGWDTRFDCNKFAAAFVSSVQLKYYRAQWRSWKPGQAAAIGEIWYVPTGAENGHAIVAAVTEKGLQFMEPQSGKFVALTDTERRSIYFTRF